MSEEQAEVIVAEPVRSAPNGEFHLVAQNSEQMNLCMAQTKAVCDRRIADLQAELADLEQEKAIAKKNRWRTSGFSRAINLAKRRVNYYLKMKAALEAGYNLVPDLGDNIVTIAIRRDGTEPDKNYVTTTHRWHDQTQKPESDLPVGEGDYVDPTPRQHSFPNKDSEGKVTYWEHHIDDLEAPLFPTKLARPEIMEIAGKATLEKIFDEIGIIDGTPGKSRQGRRRGDPLLVGRIKDPRSSNSDPRYCTFILAWFIDTTEL